MTLWPVVLTVGLFRVDDTNRRRRGWTVGHPLLWFAIVVDVVDVAVLRGWHDCRKSVVVEGVAVGHVVVCQLKVDGDGEGGTKDRRSKISTVVAVDDQGWIHGVHGWKKAGCSRINLEIPPDEIVPSILKELLF